MEEKEKEREREGGVREGGDGKKKEEIINNSHIYTNT